MPGIRTTITDKNSGDSDIRDARPKEFTLFRGQVDSAFSLPVEEMAQRYCDRDITDRWEKETIKS